MKYYLKIIQENIDKLYYGIYNIRYNNQFILINNLYLAYFNDT